ncbi:hypothetical protein SLE2022_142500 [Rubroshorea leprosula]
MTGMLHPQEVHTGATDGNGGFATLPDNPAPPVAAAVNTDRAPPNVVDPAQGFVTMADLTALLDKERSRHGATPFQFVRDPPYPKEILSKPYPKKYESPTFPKYDGRKGSAVEHVNKFLDAMGAYAGDRDLCMHEFSKSLFDRAYTWYTTLLPSSIRSWDEMLEQFCQKYFQSKERIIVLDLHNTRQCTSEDLMAYVKRFRDLAPVMMSPSWWKFASIICFQNIALFLRTLGSISLPDCLMLPRERLFSLRPSLLGRPQRSQRKRKPRLIPWLFLSVAKGKARKEEIVMQHRHCLFL